MGDNETGYLSILDEIVRRGSCPAEEKLERYHGPWAGDIDRVFEEFAY